LEKPAEQKKGMAIAMKYYYPDYFDDFECVPGHECPDSFAGRSLWIRIH